MLAMLLRFYRVLWKRPVKDLRLLLLGCLRPFISRLKFFRAANLLFLNHFNFFNLWCFGHFNLFDVESLVLAAVLGFFFLCYCGYVLLDGSEAAGTLLFELL